MKVVATLTIRCLEEEPHNILLLDNGHIHMTKHDYETEEILSKMGGKFPPCCQFVKRLREKEYWFSTFNFPGNEISEFAEKVRLVRDIHQRRRTDLSTWEKYPTIQDRHAKKLEPILQAALERTAYKKVYGGYVDKFAVYTGKNPSMWELLCGSCCCGCACETCYNEPIIGVTIDWTWQKVLNRKIEVVDGFLVLKVLEETPEHYIVLAGYQDKNYGVSVKKAMIRRDGEPHLEWLPMN